MKEIKITMLGPSSVGKTSLLAAIYDQYQRAIDITNLQITPDASTNAALTQRLQELRNLGNTDFETTGWMRRTTEFKLYNFELGERGKRPFLKLIFQDYPGEWLCQDNAKNEEVEKFLRASEVVIIAIDTPALLEKKGDLFWHIKRNAVNEITTLFERVYRNLNSPKLVILAPVRCERYYLKRDGKYEPKLLKSVKEGYANLLTHLEADALIDKVAVVVTPVQTLGNLVFNRIKLDEFNEPEIVFNKTGGKYNPVDSEQPLRYLLRFVLSKSIQTRWGTFNWLRRILDLDKDLKEALNKFTDSNNCKRVGGFEIIQGYNLLDI